MISRTSPQPEIITKVTCDCCGNDITFQFRNIGDHMSIGGYQDGKILEAIVCIKCMEEKFKFVNIQRYDNTIGHC